MKTYWTIDSPFLIFGRCSLLDLSGSFLWLTNENDLNLLNSSAFSMDMWETLLEGHATRVGYTCEDRQSLPFPSLPFPSLPFPSLPFPSLPFPPLPFPSLPSHSLPFPKIWRGGPPWEFFNSIRYFQHWPNQNSIISFVLRPTNTPRKDEIQPKKQPSVHMRRPNASLLGAYGRLF